MKDEKAKYLLVDASNVSKQLYRMERVASCNDFYNMYHRINRVKASEIFNNNNVPEEYQKIIVKVENSVFSKNKVEEYIMGYPFDYRTKLVFKKDNNKYIIMNNKPLYYNECCFADKIIFKTELFYNSFNNVLDFLKCLCKEGYLENYIKSIKEIFNVTLDLDFFYKLLIDSKSKQKAIERYAYNIACERVEY